MHSVKCNWSWYVNLWLLFVDQWYVSLQPYLYVQIHKSLLMYVTFTSFQTWLTLWLDVVPYILGILLLFTFYPRMMVYFYLPFLFLPVLCICILWYAAWKYKSCSRLFSLFHSSAPIIWLLISHTQYGKLLRGLVENITTLGGHVTCFKNSTVPSILHLINDF